MDNKAFKESFLYWTSPAMVEALVKLLEAGVLSHAQVRNYLQIK